ncbi:unnamed protein product [Penicillium salamii]|nr:unnamed protein product [Penicillium salamii]CAG8284002.1 unnamed protein product [Penicillium salamii]CAG8373759.1 unnamed protein product [Penicillium salamii]
MSTSVEAPKQFKQPSRKGKKAWRKNVDVTDVQEGLRQLTDAEIKGGLVTEKASDDLFIIDKTGNEDVRKSIAKKHKPLKADEILLKRSMIPALDGRKRGNANVTDGVIEPKTKKPKSDWVSQKEYQRLKNVARDANPIGKKTENEFYDPWAEEAEPSTTYNDPRFDFLQKPKPKVEPVTLKHAPISLAANGKAVPSVKMPHAGTSYNPVFEEWDRLLETHGAQAVEAEKKRLEEEAKEAEKQRLIEEARHDDGEVKSDDESAWEGFESEYEKSEWLNKKRPERKTKVQRNKIKRRKEAERKAKWEAQTQKREAQAEHIAKITAELAQKEKDGENQSDADDSEEGDDTVLRRKTFGGKKAVPEQPLELVLPDELQDSLRLLKPEGNLLDDRFRTLIVQGKLESRTPITQARKAKRKITEKWTAKDFRTGNWKKLQATLKKDSPKRKSSDRDADDKKRKLAEKKKPYRDSKPPLKRKRMSETESDSTTPATRRKSNVEAPVKTETSSRYKENEGRSSTAELGKYVAMDCEMVGVGPNPDHDSVLARVSVVNFNGDQIYDSYVRPKEMVTDWRTHVSGIAPKHMVEARTLEGVQKEIAEIMNGRILVGHAVSNDLDALLLGHPKRDIRDTSKHPPYRKIAGGGSPRLKVLAEEFLGLKIQDGAHSSVEDARATMALYRREKDAFEREHLKKWPARMIADPREKGEGEKKKKKKKKTTRKR